ncbi:MAG: hypothetical protein K2G83_00840 [Ruminococcus sp.]|nr:hypothetical protein [Ruminococcus sp.]
MIIFTLIYPLFMTCLAGSGLIYNKSGYGDKITNTGFFLIISGLLMTAGAFLCIFVKKTINIISLACSVSGLILCLIMLHILCTHADNAGWSDNYTMLPVSDMYKSRILPVIFPAVTAIIISFINIRNRK